MGDRHPPEWVIGMGRNMQFTEAALAAGQTWQAMMVDLGSLDTGLSA
jgi:hypothetical protein